MSLPMKYKKRNYKKIKQNEYNNGQLLHPLHRMVRKRADVTSGRRVPMVRHVHRNSETFLGITFLVAGRESAVKQTKTFHGETKVIVDTGLEYRAHAHARFVAEQETFQQHVLDSYHYPSTFDSPPRGVSGAEEGYRKTWISAAVNR